MRRLLVVLALLLAGCGSNDAPAAQVEETENLLEEEAATATAELEARVAALESQVAAIDEAATSLADGLEEALASFEAPEATDTAEIERDVQRLRDCVRSISSWIRYNLDNPNPTLFCGLV